MIIPYTTLYGGRVAMGDIDGDSASDLVTGAGRDPLADSTVRTYAHDGSQLTQISTEFVAFPATTFGVNVSAGLMGY